jgi:hypothetical protein
VTLFPADEPRPVKCRAGCGRLLTDPESIRLGFGPCCARRLGLTRPTRSRIRTPAGGTSPDQLDLLEEPVTCPACPPALAVPLRVRPGNRNPQNIYAATDDGTEVLAAVAMSPAYAAALIATINATGADRG